LVNGGVVDSPSYIVPLDLENKITIQKKEKIKKKEIKSGETS